jgi:hypothetical protein
VMQLLKIAGGHPGGHGLDALALARPQPPLSGKMTPALALKVYTGDGRDRMTT